MQGKGENMVVKTTDLIDFHIPCHSFHGCLILVSSVTLHGLLEGKGAKF